MDGHKKDPKFVERALFFLIRINSKPALYQHLKPLLSEPLNPFKGTGPGVEAIEQSLEVRALQLESLELGLPNLAAPCIHVRSRIKARWNHIPHTNTHIYIYVFICLFTYLFIHSYLSLYICIYNYEACACIYSRREGDSCKVRTNSLSSSSLPSSVLGSMSRPQPTKRGAYTVGTTRAQLVAFL